MSGGGVLPEGNQYQRATQSLLDKILGPYLQSKYPTTGTTTQPEQYVREPFNIPVQQTGAYDYSKITGKNKNLPNGLLG